MAGGPIIKNRTFSFGGYEALKERAPRALTLSVPTAPMGAGNHTGFPTIIDPLSGSAFPNNQNPSTRIDSRTQTLLQRVPLPNQASIGVGGTVNNYAVNINIKNDSDINRYFVRLDHRFGEKDTVWVHRQHFKSGSVFCRPSIPGRLWLLGTRVGNFTWNHTFSPGMLNEARVGYTYHGPVRQGMNRDFDPRTIFPDLYGPLPVGGLPQVNVSGFVSIGDYRGSERGKQLTRQFIDNITLIRGRHTLKAGIDIGNFRMSSPPGAFGLLTGQVQFGAKLLF